MSKIIIRHLSGSKANHVEEFDERLSSLSIGRDPASNIAYHPDLDDTVGRQHAIIERDANDPAKVFLKDLGSRNGTFVNKKQITQSVPLSVGDHVQLGPTGPEFEIDLDPRPAGAVKPTRVDQSTLKQTREAQTSGFSSAAPTRDAATARSSGDFQSQPSKTGLGRATVERLIAFQKTADRKTLINVAAVLLRSLC